MLSNYIVGKSRTKEGFRLVFGKVTGVTNGIVTGTQERDTHIQKLRNGFEIPVKDVIVDLGAKPHSGMVHGFDTGLRFCGKKSHEFFGDICFFYTPEKEVTKKLMEAFAIAQKVIAKAGFDFPEDAVWEIHSKESKGKFAGMYRRSKHPDKNPHRFIIKPESVPTVDMPYVILHEFAHHLHAQWMQAPKLNATWIKLYNTSIKPQTIRKDTSQQLLDLLLSGEDRPSDFKGQLEEDNRNAFNWLLRQIKADHSIGIRELDILFEAQFKDEIKALWPIRTLAKRELAPIVSEYATKDVHELIAESLSFYWTKKKLPAAIHALVEKSLSYARTQIDKT